MLSNRPSLLISNTPGRRAVSAGVWITHGAAHDPSALAGATHLIEHLTLRRCGERTRQELATLVDRLGGEVDAWTGSESMGISLQTTVDALDEALGLLCDALLAPTFDPADVDLERRVTLAEIDLVNDDPVEQVEDAILCAAWGDHPLARPVLGTPESVSGLSAAALRNHHETLVRPGRVLVSVAGDVEAAAVGDLLGDLPLSEVVRFPDLPPLRWVGNHLQVVRESVDQVHFRLAFPALPAGHPEVAALTVLNRVLGVGSSSRLFQRLREDEGLTYDIWSGLVLRGLGGMLEVGWASAPSVHNDVRRLVDEELLRLAGSVGGEEVAVAKESLARAVVMDAESTAGLCVMDVAEHIERGRRFDLDLVLAELEAVNVAEVQALAARLLRPETMATALCGPEGVAQQVA